MNTPQIPELTEDQKKLYDGITDSGLFTLEQTVPELAEFLAQEIDGDIGHE